MWLITSFRPWLAHQVSNSSDDLLADRQVQAGLPLGHRWLRNLPVDFDLAPRQVLAAIAADRPSLVLCCGMAERRDDLSIERYGRQGDRCLATAIDLDDLVTATGSGRESARLQLSEDAGNFVCNALYFAVLAAIADQALPTRALFVHVPVLTAANRSRLVAEFTAIVSHLQRLFPTVPR